MTGRASAKYAKKVAAKYAMMQARRSSNNVRARQGMAAGRISHGWYSHFYALHVCFIWRITNAHGSVFTAVG